MQRYGYEAIRAAELVEANHRAAKPHTCKCGAECLRGEDHDRCATIVTVDIEPIDNLTEAIARIDGIATFDIEPARGKNAKPGIFELHYRGPFRTVRRSPVLAEHRCTRKVTNV